MDKSLIGHGIVAAALAALAYVAWISPKETVAETTTMLPGRADNLTLVRWQEERWEVLAARRPLGFDVTVQKLNPPPKPPPSKADAEPNAATPNEAATTPLPDAPPAAPKPAPVAADSPVAPLPPPEPAKTFPGTDKVKELFDNLAPLKAARALGKLSDDKLTALGLSKPSATLTLRFDQEEKVIQVGDATFGSGDLYVLGPRGEVFLLPSATLSTIRYGATALLDKEAVAVKREQVTRLTISAGGQGREISQRHPADQEKRFFADPAEPDAKLELTSNWLDRFWRLRVIDLTDQAPTSPAALEVELFADQVSLGVLKLWNPDERVALATSSRFGKPFTVSKASAETLLKDLEPLLKEGR